MKNTKHVLPMGSLLILSCSFTASSDAQVAWTSPLTVNQQASRVAPITFNRPMDGHPAGCQCVSCPSDCDCQSPNCLVCSPRIVTGVDSATCVPCGEPTWEHRGLIPWEAFAHGEYIGPARTPHVGVYRLRVDDEIDMVYRLTRERIHRAYELVPGDIVRVESVSDDKLDRQVVVQPHGAITLPLLGEVPAAGKTTKQLQSYLDKQFEEFFKEPSITVTPIQVNTRLEDLRAVVDRRQGLGGQSLTVRVSPDGTVQLPALRPARAQGLTLEELKMELDARYSAEFQGIEVTPVLRLRAPRFLYVVGQVAQPGRFELVGPTTVTQAIALAQGWENGANLRHVVVFRRAEDWRLLATKIDIRGALYGKRPSPADEIFLRDSDVVIVPKTPIRVIDDALDLIFTNGIYAAFPILSDAFLFQDTSL